MTSATSDTVYTYVQLDDLTADKIKAIVADKTTVVNVEQNAKWGWHCDLCGEDSGAVFGRGNADMLLKRHCKSRRHKSVAASPSTRRNGPGFK